MTRILTGDIMNSKKNDDNFCLKTLKETFNTFCESPKYWQIYTGDSFQLGIKNCENAFYEALKLKSYLKFTADIDFRIGIGISKKEFNVDKITESNGEAYINSGFAFDNYKKNKQSP